MEMSLTTENTNTKSVSMPPDREALSLMTKLKLDRFKLRKKKFEEEYTQVMVQKTDSEISLLDKIYMLVKSIESLFAEEGKERYLKNFDAILAISKANTSISNNLLENLYLQLMKIIVGGKKRSEYNYLFGLIMSQWLTEHKKDEFIPTEIQSTSSESILTNEQLEKYIFSQPELDLDQWHENVINEFASSLTLIISDLTDWKWSIEGVRGIFCRNIAGKYRCFYEEDFLTAIFLEHIGLMWSYHFKRELKQLFDIMAKKSQKNCSSKSIQYERLMQQKEYWMGSLPDEFDSKSGLAYYTNTDTLDLKTKLFYLINVEIQLHQVLKPDASFSVVSTDLEWFGPSISHDIIQIFLQFCGMPQIWLDFFHRFLKQPVYYKPGEAIRQRERGVPISHSLSFLFSELLLFGMDVYVYQSTGIFNYRLHDDFWFFHTESDKIEQAWTLMNEYAQMTGLKFNEEKCGSVRIQPVNGTNQVDKISKNILLPRKDVKWGLLTLQSSGRFVINQNAIIPFMDAMKMRLTNASTILEWIEIYNTYILFFMRSFGKCANILGINHIEQMIETFQYIHRYVFHETNGNALTILTDRILQQFPACLTDEICEAWFYWPVIQGGLGLKNIYLDLYALQHWLSFQKIVTFDQLPAKDTELYAEIVEKYKQTKNYQRNESLQEFIHDDGTLITFDEYIQDRETHLSHWKNVYTEILAITPMLLPVKTINLEEHIQIVRDRIKEMSYNKQRRQNKDNDSYIEWLVCYYGGQIESTFNQLDFIDSENLPIGLIMLMKTTKIDWNKDSKYHQ